jgi:hypothetical protein
MALRLFPLIAYLAALVYLVCWLFRQLRAIYQRVRAWWLKRRVAGKLLSLNSLKSVGQDRGILIGLGGALCGGVFAFWLAKVFIQEWLLVIFVVMAVLSEDIRVSPKETLLLEVVVFFDRLAVFITDDQDLFEALAKVVQDLP